jgi:hypothetical protein
MGELGRLEKRWRGRYRRSDARFARARITGPALRRRLARHDQDSRAGVNLNFSRIRQVIERFGSRITGRLSLRARAAVFTVPITRREQTEWPVGTFQDSWQLAPVRSAAGAHHHLALFTSSSEGGCGGQLPSLQKHLSGLQVVLHWSLCSLAPYLDG